MIDFNRLFRSFKHAIDGIHYALISDQNLVIHFFSAFVIILLSILFRISAYEMAILGVTILVVISTEMLNSSVEKMVDLITKEHRTEAKIAKDVSAGMVLLTSIGALIIGVLIFAPYIAEFFKNN